MARYIEEVKAADIISEKLNIPLIDLFDVFAEIPTAEVEEVKHGEWIPVQYTYFGLKRYECSECKDDDYWQKRYLEHKEKYCPNCGAKMDLGGEDDNG